MAARPRDRKRRDWPEGLREPRPGYFTWRRPNGNDMAIGRVPLAQAIREARAANDYARGPASTLVDRMTGAGNTIAQLLDRMPVAKTRNTLKFNGTLDTKIRAALGDKLCNGLTVKHCADLLQVELDAGQQRAAQALRSRLRKVCAKGMALGWMDANPADPTETDAVVVKRARLTLEQFQAILDKAPEVKEWLPGAMLVALVSGQDRSTVAAARKGDIGPEYWTARRSKTGVAIEIPLALRLDAIGMTLREALAACGSTVATLRGTPDDPVDFIVHHWRAHRLAPVGSSVGLNKISQAFADARRLAGIEDVLPDGKLAPTFHELRSLAKRLYKDQGGVDTKALLAHSTEAMGELYADPRGVAPIRIKLG